MNTESDSKRSALFAALREHPDFESWMNHDPGSLDARGCRDLFGFALLLLVGAALSLVTVALLPQLAAVPIALVALGAVALVVQLLKRPKHTGPLLRRPVSILEVSAQVSTGAGASGENHYLVTVEDEGGAREALEASPEVAAHLQPNLQGVAFSRGKGLILFTPLISAGAN